MTEGGNVPYKLHTVAVVQTKLFAGWLAQFRDRRTRSRIVARLARLETGNMGDVKPVGEGESELRLLFGAGYRVYFVQIGTEIIILLCDGDKSTQEGDIAKAKRMAKEHER